ncbi:MAG: PBP1A family penicillin-binding protein [Proteobacteria bacterium]|nr:PBP1A family penicillin-binding protein [Pseudomonadota bacterium]
MTSRVGRVTAGIMWLTCAGLCGAVLTLAGAFLYLDPQVPKAESYRHVKLETPLRVFAADGGLIAEFGERRLIPIGMAQIPDLFVKALLDTEDKRFYSHSGIDFISFVNDFTDLLINQEIRGGFSTITMQLSRNVSFTLERTIIRKLKEMLLALKIEQELTKDEILELYINVVPFGKRAYGAEAAARTYYGKPLVDLSLPQLAMLAGIPQAPTAGNPINGPERALNRRNLVLARMREQNSITEQEYQNAINAPITARLHARDLDIAAPFPAEWVRSELINRYRDLYSGGYEVHTTIDSKQQAAATRAVRAGLLRYDNLHGWRGVEGHVDEAQILEQNNDLDLTDPFTLRRVYLNELAAYDPVGGLLPVIVTAVDELKATVITGQDEMIDIALEDMRWARPYISVDSRGSAPKTPSDLLAVGDIVRLDLTREAPRLAQVPEIQGALVSMDPVTGAVRALEGGFDFATNQYNHVLQAARQPGSGFKPFVYSAALHHGVTPASIFMDAPLVFDDANLESQYRPGNDNSRFNGPTRLRVALYRSINLVSMRVLSTVGAGNVLDYVSRFGFDTSTFPRNTQLAIGGGTMAVTPIDMARAYSVIPNGGFAVQPYIISRMYDLEGNLVFAPRYPVACRSCEREEQADKTLAPTGPDAAEPATLEDLFSDTASEQPLLAERVIDERVAYIVNTMLSDVIKHGTGRRALKLNRADLAGKTGTTNEAADTWFNGFNQDIVTTVWVGFDDHQPLGKNAYGSNTPLPIWIEFMETALLTSKERPAPLPSGVVTMKINPQTGQRAEPGETGTVFEYFLREHTPKVVDRPNKTNPGTEQIKPEELF